MALAARSFQGPARAHRQQSAGVGCSGRALAPAAPVRPARAPRQCAVVARAERGSDGFVTGFVMGGIVFGALGFLFAPQISRALLGDDQRLRLPRFMEEEGPKDPEATKQDLIDKIAQLNASIDEVAATLKAKDASAEAATQS
ncbi:hypothetical protein Rsub_07613 [Raphidocelis subcapitata]|uniref:Uncharacterized protein n=1 Tax=Raphidocelis subcapitata TaxID=307507 RepID=A0A2V0PA45_9CHLO|nr:hypothetical protein Rsub_07613 [Raphidocelis subcapitata]|eukprot:GBF94730.1 hypothetical protein Rsub_07613 [Raphidocelis subcapitata]